MDYRWAENKWHEVVPIRGRAEQVRPIGKRSRDWETIVRVDLGEDKSPDERWAYAAKLHDTNVVTWYPDGTLGVRCGGWPTTSTSKFIHKLSPLICVKANRKLWVYNGRYDAAKYPVPEREELRLRLVPHTGMYEPVGGYAPKIMRTDRTATKPLRQQLAPFLNWVKTFLAMSDGVIQPETYAQVLEGTRPHYTLPSQIRNRLEMDNNLTPAHIIRCNWGIQSKTAAVLRILCNLTEDDYLPFLCYLTLTNSPFRPTYWTNEPMHVDYPAFKEWVHGVIRALPECRKEVDYIPSDKITRNIV